MPLPAPAAREHLHTRTIECRAYHREDDLWDIEARLLDVKTYDFTTDVRGEIKAGTPVHDIWLRLTLDKNYLIQDVEASTELAPFPTCGGIAPNYKQLVGLRIGPGWRRGVKKVVAGTEGCTHLTEMLSTIATVAFQAIGTGRRIRREMTEEQKAARMEAARKFLLNSCHAWASDGEAVKRMMPDAYTGDDH